jgi:hypothetical protein
MCRSIKTLRRPDQPATDEEISAAALQYVRKLSGYRAPSKRNAEAFQAAVVEVALATRRLLEAIGPLEPLPAPLVGRSAPRPSAADPSGIPVAAPHAR